MNWFSFSLWIFYFTAIILQIEASNNRFPLEKFCPLVAPLTANVLIWFYSFIFTFSSIWILENIKGFNHEATFTPWISLALSEFLCARIHSHAGERSAAPVTSSLIHLCFSSHIHKLHMTQSHMGHKVTAVRLGVSCRYVYRLGEMLKLELCVAAFSNPPNSRWFSCT